MTFPTLFRQTMAMLVVAAAVASVAAAQGLMSGAAPHPPSARRGATREVEKAATATSTYQRMASTAELQGKSPRPGEQRGPAAGPVGFSSRPGKLWLREGCFAFDPESRWLTLTVSREATLSGLATHFDTSTGALRNANPSLHSSRLVAGESYFIPTKHLSALRHEVRGGDTLASIGERYGVPNKFSIRTWNCLPSDTVKTAESLLIFSIVSPEETAARTGAGSVTLLSPPERLLSRPSCYAFDPAAGLMLFTIYRGTTESGLATHFDLYPGEIDELNPTLRSEGLLRGERYWIPVGHLEHVLHRVRRGDTLDSIAREYAVPNKFSIRTWNCLGTDTLREGDELLVFQNLDCMAPRTRY